MAPQENWLKGDTPSEWDILYPSPLSPSGCLEFRCDSWSSSSHLGLGVVLKDGSWAVKMAEQKDGRHLVPDDLEEEPHQSYTISFPTACTWENEPHMISSMLFWSQMQFLTVAKSSLKDIERIAQNRRCDCSTCHLGIVEFNLFIQQLFMSSYMYRVLPGSRAHCGFKRELIQRRIWEGRWSSEDQGVPF